MLIRHAVPDDLEQVADLFDQYRRFYGKPADLALARTFIRARLQTDDSVVLVAEGPGGNLAGFTQLFPSFSSVSAARVYILNDLFVAPAWRRRGVAGELLEAARQFGERAGAVRLSLSTAVDNHAAQALYESLGWIRDDAFHYYNLTLSPQV